LAALKNVSNMNRYVRLNPPSCF